MSTIRVLVIEDDPWIGFLLEELITETAESEVMVHLCSGVLESEFIKSDFDVAFLDVNSADGKTYKIASELGQRNVPFAFMSAHANRAAVPESLRHAPFLSKPYWRGEVRSVLNGVRPRPNVAQAMVAAATT